MNKVITYVPKDKDLLFFIAEEVKRAEKSWLFLHKNVLEALSSTADSSGDSHDQKYLLWNEGGKRELAYIEGTLWSKLILILDNRIRSGEGSAFVWYQPDDPEKVIFLKMEGMDD